MKTQNKESQAGNATKSTSSSSTEKLKTDMPISEKDEVKSAERRMRKKALKDHL
jgi:hypothetical protein